MEKYMETSFYRLKDKECGNEKTIVTQHLRNEVKHEKNRNYRSNGARS